MSAEPNYLAGLEVLEHLQYDRMKVSKVEPGTPVIIPQADLTYGSLDYGIRPGTQVRDLDVVVKVEVPKDQEFNELLVHLKNPASGTKWACKVHPDDEVMAIITKAELAAWLEANS